MASSADDRSSDDGSREEARPDVERESPPERAPGLGAATAPKSLEVDGIVRDIREGLAAISSRELDLRRQEHGIAEQYRELKRAARQAAATEVEQVRGQLARRAAELDAKTIELSARDARLSELAREVRAREVVPEGRGAGMEGGAQESRVRADAGRAEIRRQREALHDRMTAVRIREEELDKRIRLARDAVLSQRADLAAREQRVREAEQTLLAREAEAERRIRQHVASAGEDQQERGEVADEFVHVARERARLDSEHAKLRVERAHVEEQQRQLAAGQSALEKRGQVLIERQAEFDRRRQATDAHGRQLAREAENLEAWRRSVRTEEQESQTRVERLARQEEQLREKIADLEPAWSQLEQREAELQNQQATIDESQRQAEQAEERVRRQRDEVAALHEQTESCENEMRQAGLALEVDRERVECEKAAAESAAGELGRAEAVLRERFERLAKAEHSVFAAPRTWALRSLGLAVAVALSAALGWLHWHPARQRATVELRITSADAVVENVLSRHRGRLLDPGLLAEGRGGSELAETWRAACESGRAIVSAADDEPVLRLTVSGLESEGCERLVAAAARAYAEQVDLVALSDHRPPRHDTLVARRAELESKVGALRRERAVDEGALGALPEPGERKQVQARVAALEEQSAAIVAALDTQRAELAALVSGDVPRGSVAPGDVGTALAEDAIYQEDRLEFGAVALQYRTELVVAMVLVVDPTEAVQAALGEFAALVSEQRTLDPPASVSAVLEECDADVAQAEERFAGYAEQWQAWLEVVQALDLRADVVELVRQQAQVADAARQISDYATSLTDEVGVRIERLTTVGDGSTREIVVAAVLRSEHAVLVGALESFLAAARNTAPTDNFELDAHDRKLRGLRMRLQRRREAVAQRLQLEADRVAREEHTQRVQAVREEVRHLERQREELVTGTLAAVRALRALGEQAVQREELELRLRQRDAQIAWLDARQSEIEVELADLRRQGREPDQVEVGQPAVEALTLTRYRDASLVGLGGFVGTWLLCLLVVMKASGGPRKGGANLREGLVADR